MQDEIKSNDHIYKNPTQACRDKISKAKAHNEIKLARR